MKEYITNVLMGTLRENIESLIEYMDDTGFFYMPCSGAHHLAKEGGLAEHTGNVIKLADELAKMLLDPMGMYDILRPSVHIAAALHDLGKTGQFDKPGYVPNILKSGEQSESKPYKQNPELLNVPHEIRSVAIAQMFIDLTEEEQFAILNHNGLYGALKYELIGRETPLYMILHFADMWASRVVER